MSTPAPLNPRWLYGLVLFQFAVQVALLAAGLGPVRIALRVAMFAPSLIMLAVPATRRMQHPDSWLVWLVVGLTTAGLFHPRANTPQAGLAQILLTLAVWAPVLWVPKIAVNTAVLARLVVLIWGFSTASAAVGVLQVYAPGTFAPDPEFARQIYGVSADGLKLTLDDGSVVFRPAGLSDSPGGAALAGMTAIVTGLAVVRVTRNWVLRMATLPAAVMGLFCLLVCQVRSLLILTALSVAGIVVLYLLTGRLGRAALAIGTAGAVAVGGYGWSVSVGGQAVTSRLASLGEASAGEVYYSHRGIFLEDTLVNLLPDYPFGAGLGRWGMMLLYFGDPGDPNSPPLHAEIQPTGWVYDGGLFLMLAGYGTMAMLVWRSFLIATRAQVAGTADLAAAVLALNVGVVFTTFGAHVFVAQTGLQFCLLNAALFAAARGHPRSAVSRLAAVGPAVRA